MKKILIHFGLMAPPSNLRFDTLGEPFTPLDATKPMEFNTTHPKSRKSFNQWAIDMSYEVNQTFKGYTNRINTVLS